MPYCSQYKFVFSATFYTQRLIDFATYTKSWLDSRQGTEFFLFSKTSRPALRRTQPFTQWWAGTLCQIKNWLGRYADQSTHVVPRLRMSGAITPLPYIPPRSEQIQFSFFTLDYIEGVYNGCSTQAQVHFLGNARWVCLRKTDSGEVLLWFPPGNQHSTNPYYSTVILDP